MYTLPTWYLHATGHPISVDMREPLATMVCELLIALIIILIQLHGSAREKGFAANVRVIY